MPKTIAPPKSERTESEIAALDIPEAAIEQPEDDSVGRIIAEHIKPTLTGLVITGELSCEEWLKAAEFYQFLRSRTQWIIGDILRYGESRYGEKYAQAVDDHGKSSSRLSTYVYVCNRFEIERRRPELSFDHHAECAGLDPREADRVLLEAIKMRWTKQDVREEVAKINERNGVPKRGRKPGSTAAKVAASGKTPQVPEGEKPLIWNGYPLRVAITDNGWRIILQGSEVLTAEVAERAAHHHKFAHGPALAAWLEEHNFIKPEGGESTCAQTTTSQCSDKSKSPPSPTASGLDTPEKIASASNGAAPNATESAPTPSGILAQLDTIIEAETNRCQWCMEGQGRCKLPKDHKPPCEFPPLPAPAAPPASPEPEKLALRFHEVYERLAPSFGYETRQETRAFDPTTPNGKLMIAVCGELLRTNEVSAESSRGAATATLTPLQRAEEAILRFNEASKAVDWAEVGRNALRRVKWLGAEGSPGLLNTADSVIDQIQNNPPTPRK